jgi:hypothetical protein
MPSAIAEAHKLCDNSSRQLGTDESGTALCSPYVLKPFFLGLRRFYSLFRIKVTYLYFETLCIMDLVIMADLSYAKHLLYMQSLLNIVGSGCKPASLILGVRVQPTR